MSTTYPTRCLEMLATAAVALLTGCGPLSCARACKPPLEPSAVIILAHEYGVTAIHGGSLGQELLCSSPMGAGSSALPVVRPGRDGQVLVLGDGGVTTCDGGIRLSRERHAAPRTWRVESPDGSGVIVVDECALLKHWTGRNCRGRLKRPDGETVDLARTVNMDANAPLWLDREAIVYRDSTGTNVIQDFARGTVREVGEPGWVVVSAENGESKLIAHDGRRVFTIDPTSGRHRDLRESPRFRSLGGRVTRQTVRRLLEGDLST